jgi:hypothetical protein
MHCGAVKVATAFKQQPNCNHDEEQANGHLHLVTAGGVIGVRGCGPRDGRTHQKATPISLERLELLHQIG